MPPRSSSNQRSGPGGGRPAQFGNQRPKRDPSKKKLDPLKIRGITYIDYRDIRILERFINDRGKILPNRITGLSAANQRKVERAIKRARHLALLPFVAEGMK
jgi:small subunit ribosomal protein S18